MLTSLFPYNTPNHSCLHSAMEGMYQFKALQSDARNVLLNDMFNAQVKRGAEHSLCNWTKRCVIYRSVTKQWLTWQMPSKKGENTTNNWPGMHKIKHFHWFLFSFRLKSDLENLSGGSRAKILQVDRYPNVGLWHHQMKSFKEDEEESCKLLLRTKWYPSVIGKVHRKKIMG